MIKGNRKNIKIFLNYFLGPVIFCILCWMLYIKLKSQNDLSLRWAEIKESFSTYKIWLALMLVLANYGLEAFKWQLLTRNLQILSFKTAVKAVLAGCSVTMLTPNRIGEYGGRIIFLNEENRIAAIPITMLGSISQLFATIIFGTVGLIVMSTAYGESNFLKTVIPDAAYTSLLIFGIALSFLLIFLYLQIGWITQRLLQFTRMKKIMRYLHFLSEYSRKELLRILFLSVVRYLIFILQFMLVVSAMKVLIPPMLCFWLLTVFYLTITLAPTIGFTELPIRVAASTLLLQLYSSNVLGIQAASLSIWCINVMLPALVGSALIFGLKIIKEK